WGGTGQAVFATALDAKSWIGNPLDQHARPVGKDQCLGWVDLKEANNDNNDETTFVGWACDEADAAPPLAVLSVDSDSAIAGEARLDIPRPDIRKAIPAITSEKVGWRSVVEGGPDPQLTAYALLASKDACLLGRTQ